MPRKAKEKVVENDVLDEKVKEKKDDKKVKKTTASTTKKAASSSTKKTTSTVKKTKTSTAKKDEVPTEKKATKKTTKVVEEKKTAVKKSASTPKKTATKKSATTKVAEKETEQTPATKKNTATKAAKTSTTKKATTKTTKSSTAKKATTKTTKSSTAKKATTKTAKSSTAKKTTTKKTSTKTAKSSTAKKTSSKNVKNAEQNIQILEYYDLPYKYGNTIVKLLAQTPKTLFVYWEISDADVEDFKQKYGDNFFNITKPILIVHNLTLNKTSEVEINDFANCWYLNIEDADCKFDIELARKFISTPSNNSNVHEDDYLYVAKSNDLQTPNDHIMFEHLTSEVTFKNYKTKKAIIENAESFEFLKDIYKFYQNMYKDELLKNPSSKF